MIWTLIASFGLICGVTSPAGAQIAETGPAHAPSEVLRLSSPPSEGSSRDGMSLSPPSLDPYHSLEKHVERVERVPIRLLSPPGARPAKSGVRLSRGQKVLLGTLGLIVHRLCHPRTNGALGRTGQTIEPNRQCHACERVGDRAATAIIEGLFFSTP